MVLISRENKRKIYSYLLNEGVMVVKKDFSTHQHPDVDVPNLQVWMQLRTLCSKGVVDVTFNWRHYYYNVKTEGLKTLRDGLGIVEENVVPITFKKTRKDFLGREEREDGEDRPRRGGRGRGGRGGRGFGRGRRDQEQQETTEQPEGEAQTEVKEENYE